MNAVVYWCRECRNFVGKYHRCEQWAQVVMIPTEAIEAYKSIGPQVDEAPIDDIPIGTPCEFDCTNGICIGYFSHYDDGVPQFVFRKDEIGMLDCGISGHSVRQLGIWNIPEKYGGAPKWAIARAYNESKNIWLYDEFQIKCFTRDGYTIERRLSGGGMETHPHRTRDCREGKKTYVNQKIEKLEQKIEKLENEVSRFLGCEYVLTFQKR